MGPMKLFVLCILLSFVHGKNDFVCHQRDPECVPNGNGNRHTCTYDWTVTQQNTMRLNASQMSSPPPGPPYPPGQLNYTVQYPIQKEEDPGEWTRLYYNYCDMDVYNRSASVCEPENIYVDRDDTRFIGADGYLSTKVYSVNGKLPGPTICVHWKDTIVVHVKLDVPGYGIADMTIHWHGQFQKGTPWMDGVPNVAQCPITQGQEFTYEFLADPAGSFWYHSHVGLQYDDGVFGALVILDEEELRVVDGLYHQSPEVPENIMLIGDWDHEEAQVEYLKGPLHYIFDDGTPFKVQQSIDGGAIAGVPFSSALINGYGSYENNDGYVFQPWVFYVPQNEFVRFRLISSAGDFAFRVSIDSHKLKIIAMDAFDIDPPVDVDAVIVYPAERYDFIIDTSGNNGATDFWIRLETLEYPSVNPVTKAILSYSDPATVASYVAGDHIDPPLLSSMTDDYMLDPSNCDDNNPCLVMNCPWPEKYINSTAIYCTTPGEQTRHPDEYNEPDDLPDVADAIAKGNVIYLNYNVLAEQNIGEDYTKKYERPNIDGIWTSFPPSNLLTTKDLSTIPNACPNDEKVGSFEECVRWIDLEYNESYLFVLTNRWPQSTEGVGNFPGFMPHPSHMHGHSFYILAEDAGTITDLANAGNVADNASGCKNGLLQASQYCYDNFTQDFNLVCTQGWGNCTFRDFDAVQQTFVPIENAPRKDTIAIPPHGYVVIAIRADNPGWWIWHCHIENHLAAGMALVLNEAWDQSQELIEKSLPDDFPTCGSFNNVMKTHSRPQCNIQTNACVISCKSDYDCPTDGEQCCFNGCGQMCQSLGIKANVTIRNAALQDAQADISTELTSEIAQFLGIPDNYVGINSMEDDGDMTEVSFEIISGTTQHSVHELYLALKNTLHGNGFDGTKYPILAASTAVECLTDQADCPDELLMAAEVTWLSPISGYFTEDDAACMAFLFNLSDYYDVVANGHVIYSVVESGQMPKHKPPMPWSKVWVSNFALWIKEGYPYGSAEPPPPPETPPEPDALIDLPGAADVQLRYEYNEFSQNHIQRSLFLHAFLLMQEMPLKPNGSPEQWSFEAIARIHGEPAPWYCIHGAPQFPSWHRPYVMLFETAIRKAARTLLGGANQGTDWDTEYELLRVPFWDWGGHSADGTPFAAPNDFLTEEVTVLAIRSNQNETITNPLYSYTYKGTPPLSGSGDEGLTTGSTMRYIALPQNDQSTSNNDLMAEAFLKWNSDAQTLMVQCMKQTEWDKFATTQYGKAQSMENPHNIGHLIIGGGYYGNYLGQMSVNTVAGFEPLFFLHHGQVERLLTIWQVINSNTYMTGLETVTPFNIADGFVGTPATNANMREFENYGYSYPMVQAASTPEDLLQNFVASYSGGQEQQASVEFTVNQINPDLTESFVVEVHAVAADSDSPILDNDSDTFVGRAVLFTGGSACTNCDAAATSTLEVDFTTFLQDHEYPPDTPLIIWARVLDVATGEYFPLSSVCLKNPVWKVTDGDNIPIKIIDIDSELSTRFHCSGSHCLCNECEDCSELEECGECEDCDGEGSNELLSVGRTGAFMSPETVAMSVVGVCLIFLAAVMFK